MKEQIKITGYKDAEMVDSILSSNLVDIAYFIEEKNNSVILELDESIDPKSKKDFAWLNNLINQVLTENGEQNVTISCV